MAHMSGGVLLTILIVLVTIAVGVLSNAVKLPGGLGQRKLVVLLVASALILVCLTVMGSERGGEPDEDSIPSTTTSTSGGLVTTFTEGPTTGTSVTRIEPSSTSGPPPTPTEAPSTLVHLAAPEHESLLSDALQSGFFAASPLEVSGTRYQYGLRAGTTLGARQARIIFRLDGKYRWFLATVGMVDGKFQAADTVARITVTTDSSQEFGPFNVQRGTEKRLHLDVRGVEYLTIAADCDRSAFPGIGDPRATS